MAEAPEGTLPAALSLEQGRKEIGVGYGTRERNENN